MKKGIFIIGTDTDVGKTIVSGSITYMLRNSGFHACYFKPVLSGALRQGPSLTPLDTRFVKELAGLDESLTSMTPYCFETPVSPHLASALEGQSISPAHIKNAFTALKNKYQYMIVEGAGGLMVPLNNTGYMLYHLIQELNMDIWIVAKAGLGTINHTLLTVSAARNLGIQVKGILINQYDPMNICEKDNLLMIQQLTSLPILGVLPKIPETSVEDLKYENLKTTAQNELDIALLIKHMGDL